MMSTQDPTFATLVKDLVDRIGKLVRQELQLAQAEVSEKASQAQAGLISIAAGLLLAFAALLVLLQALVISLANVVAPWLASVIVGVVVAIVAFALLKSGQNSLKAQSLVPHRTVRSIQEDKDMVMEKVK